MLVIVSYLLAACLYLTKQAAFLFGGDAAEYNTVAATWSIPHPPGYPFFSFLLNINRYILPGFPPILRDNLLSIVPTLGSSIVLYLLLKRITNRKYISLYVALFYLILFPIWLYGEVTEVFALNNLFIISITYAIIRYRENTSSIYQYILFLLGGLAVAHHQTIIIFAPAWIYLMWGDLIQLFRHKILLKLMLALVGIGFYIYPPIASHFNPPIDWENAQTLSGLIRLVLRSSYGSITAYAGSIPNIVNQMLNTFSTLFFIIQDFKPAGIAFILLGSITAYYKCRRFAIFLYISFFSQIVLFFLTNFFISTAFALAVYERYLLSLYIILSCFFCFGIIAGYDYLINLCSRYLRSSLRRLPTIIAVIYLLAFFAISFRESYAKISYLPISNQFNRFAEDILNTPPRDSIISTKGDTAYFTTAYYYMVRKMRQDLKFIFVDMLSRGYYAERVRKQYPDVIIPPQSDNSAVYYKRFLEDNTQKHAILFESPKDQGYWAPYGLLWRYFNTHDDLKTQKEVLIQENERLWSKVYRIPKLNDEQKSILFLNSLQDYYLTMLYSYSQFLLYEDQPQLAINHLNAILNDYNPHFSQARLALINEYIKEKNCSKANSLDPRKTSVHITLNPTDIKSIVLLKQSCKAE
ncbi:DUF2723 domain-containing protein [Candidatus Roizmanbacteria bacterium]|nr:DUF2723 domain-containing protein [Candidatus Roizmanbacteria bacterium]